MSERVIVSRHPAAIEFVKSTAPEFADAPVLASAGPEDVRGKIVAGNLPLHLAALAREVWAVEFDGPAPRGQEYSLEDMYNAGARLRRYVVLSEDQLNRMDRVLSSDGYVWGPFSAIDAAKKA